MPIHLNPFRPYSGRVQLTKGLLAEMLRNTVVFWEAYQELLQMNGKTESSNKDLKRIMEQMKLAPKAKSYSPKKTTKLVFELETSFVNALNSAEVMLKSLDRITANDETLLYRAMKELARIYLHVSKIKHIPEHMLQGTLTTIHSLMHRMYQVQHHTWIVSKAHSRGMMKVEEMTILSTRLERRRIRMQTIEIDHLRNIIDRLRGQVFSLHDARSQEDIYKFNDNIRALLKTYHTEIEDLEKILHELHILVR
ncbi:MAG: hypothetical protein V1729_01290, partial [Candidatus Woesearchaeota archaeon]